MSLITFLGSAEPLRLSVAGTADGVRLGTQETPIRVNNRGSTKKCRSRTEAKERNGGLAICRAEEKEVPVGIKRGRRKRTHLKQEQLAARQGMNSRKNTYTSITTVNTTITLQAAAPVNNKSSSIAEHEGVKVIACRF